MRERNPISVPRWQPPLASETRVRRQLILIAGAIGSALAIGGVAFETTAPLSPRLVWNASASVPTGLYSVTPVRPIERGDIVVARLPEPVARLAARRHYLPLDVPLLKPVGALPGDRVCAIGGAITIDGNVVAIRRRRDRIGRALPWWNGCERLRNGRLLLLSPAPDSFDGRYFGPVDPSTIIGRARPLWIDRASGLRP